MKIFVLLPLLLLSVSLFAENKSDSTQNNKSLRVSGDIQLTNNGISPVPAFSLGKPALMTEIILKKGNISFNPQFNYGIDGKPWSSNNWLRIQFPSNKFTFRTGVNWSLFFKRENIIENNRSFEVQRVNKYLEWEAAVFYQLSPKTSLNFIFWHDNGIDIDAVKYGDFLSLSANITKIPLSESFSATFQPNFFYLKNAIPFEGVFISGIGIISYKNCPFTLSVQGVQPIWVKPSSTFNWNIGLNWKF